ncbi:hypothetical protein C2845_PM09G10430 [Panicum miliaceum]|uniref:Uncharacterized protein n=1 Tax=Panicum miliaceum TaxID=4540 RepID=A0A3L6RZR5_PANMI|nr:hypothetical protein C2845_PM09G10430 [Panicum miliaceum]
MEPEPSSCSSGLDEFIDSLDEMHLPLIPGIEENSVTDAFSTRVPTRLSAFTYGEALRSKSLSDLEEDLDLLLKLGDEDATAIPEAPVFDAYTDSDDDHDSSAVSHLGLSITTTALYRFMYWKGMEPSELLDNDARLVATIQELPFQQGRPLSPIQEERSGSTASTVLVTTDYSGDYSPKCEVYMASIRDVNNDEPGIEFDNELENDISGDENTADTPQDEDEEKKRRHYLRNSRQNKRRRNAQERARNPHWRRNLQGEFEAAADEEFVTPMGNIYEASLLLQQIPQTDATHRIMRLVKQAGVQLDMMDPLKSVQHTRSRSERHDSFVPQASRTARGHPNPRNNRLAEKEVQQQQEGPRPRGGGQPVGGQGHQGNQLPLPPGDLR